MFQHSNMFDEHEQERINKEAQEYLSELYSKSPDQIFKALLTWHVVHQKAMYEKIYEEQERISLLLEEFLDVVYETDEIINESVLEEADECLERVRDALYRSIENGYVYTYPSTSADHNTIQSEDHRQPDQELSQ